MVWCCESVWLWEGVNCTTLYSSITHNMYSTVRVAYSAVEVVMNALNLSLSQWAMSSLCLVYKVESKSASYEMPTSMAT